MTDPKQSLYDILGEAFNAGKEHVLLSPDEPSAASVLFPLAARMEAEVQKLVKVERNACANIATTWTLAKHNSAQDIKTEILRRSLPSSPERETL